MSGKKLFSPEWTPAVLGPCGICGITIVESTKEPVDENDTSQAGIYANGKFYHVPCWNKAKEDNA